MKSTVILFFAILHFVQAQSPSTWQTVQSDILDINCVMCHYEGSSFANQSGLVLTSDVAYQNLIDITPTNLPAAEDELVRISTIGGQPGLEKSFFWKKIDATEQEHYYEDHSNYGSLMPLGLPYLTNGELKLIEEWIVAGAPETGIVADISLLQDTSRYTAPEFAELTPPDTGFQLHVGPVDIWSAEVHDREFLYFEPLQTEEELYMTGYEISMRPGSHHYIVYNYEKGLSTPPPHTYRDMRTKDGIDNFANLIALNNLFPFRFFVGTQTPYIKYSFPEGIALTIPPGSGFDHNLHSSNRSGETRSGEVYTNIYTTAKSKVKYQAYNGNFSNYNINLPPNQVTTLTKTFKFSEKTNIIQLWSHAHEKMTEFKIERVGGEKDGELIYFTHDWEHPPYLRLDPPMTFEANEGVKLITTYNNWEDRTITFGPLSSDEMQFMFFIYFTGDYIADPTGIKSDNISSNYSLEQNYPNPFNPATKIHYSIPVAVPSLAEGPLITLKIYDILGREVTKLVNEEQKPGEYEIIWDASNYPSGVYFYKLTARDYVNTKKMLLIK